MRLLVIKGVLPITFSIGGAYPSHGGDVSQGGGGRKPRGMSGEVFRE